MRLVIIKEANWVQDSFFKDSMIIDTSYRQFLNEIKAKHVSQ